MASLYALILFVISNAAPTALLRRILIAVVRAEIAAAAGDAIASMIMTARHCVLPMAVIRFVPKTAPRRRIPIADQQVAAEIKFVIK
jgi:hypothetical protein